MSLLAMTTAVVPSVTLTVAAPSNKKRKQPDFIDAKDSAVKSTRPLFASAFTTLREKHPLRLYNYKFLITTNELPQYRLEGRTTFEKIMDQPMTGDTILGTGGFFTLNIAALRGQRLPGAPRLQHIIMVDNSVYARYFWQSLVQIIAKSTSKESAYAEIIDLINSDSDEFLKCDKDECADEDCTTKRAVVEIEDLNREIRLGISWLSSNEQFTYIKMLFDNGDFVYLSLDLTEPSEMALLKASLDASGGLLDTIYLSNVAEFAEEETGKLVRMRRALAPLIPTDALVIKTVPRCRCSMLFQMVFRIGEATMEAVLPASLRCRARKTA